jgi:branched-chain amino acid transport system permease protein
MSIKNLIICIAILAGLVALPHFLAYNFQDLLIFLTVNVLVVVSYRLVTLTGEWSLIHIVLMGVGAYASAMLSKMAGFPFWVTMPLAGLTAAGVAAILCFPLFRMTQFYFLIGSFAAGEAIRLVWIYFIDPFGGTSGINNLPVPVLGDIDFYEPIPYFYMTLAIVTFSLFILYRIETSRVGLTLNAVHWKAPLAESVGVNTWKYRSLALIIGSFFVGIAGALKVHYLGVVTPHQFGVGVMVFVLIWVIVGGYAGFVGPIIGVVVLTVFDQGLRASGLVDPAVQPAVYGAVLIASILFMPEGLEGLPKRIMSRVKGDNV